MDAIHSEVYKGHKISIVPDDNMESPRNWDNAATLACWHRRYILGDEQPGDDPHTWLLTQVENDPTAFSIAKSIARHSARVYPNGVVAQVRRLYDSNAYDWLVELDAAPLDILERAGWIIESLRLYDHGGISISLSSGYPYNDCWDSGWVGFAYMDPATIQKEWGSGPGARARATACLHDEVETYDRYLRGEVYGYVVERLAVADIENVDLDDDVLHGETVDSCWGFVGDYTYCLSEARSAVDWIKYAEKNG